MSFELAPGLVKVILKMEKLLRSEYEIKYLSECMEKGIAPLRYAAWRHEKMEPRILEMLIEENRSNSHKELEVI